LADSIRAERVQLFPNPATEGNFTISGIEGIKQIAIYDLLGKKVTEFKDMNQSEINIQMNALKGIYLVTLSDGTQTIHRKITVN